MMSSTLGAPLGGTTRGGHQGLESLELSLITPPNFGGGGGSCFPSIVVVALGEPGTPTSCWANALTASLPAMTAAPTPRPNPFKILRRRRLERPFLVQFALGFPRFLAQFFVHVLPPPIFHFELTHKTPPGDRGSVTLRSSGASPRDHQRFVFSHSSIFVPSRTMQRKPRWQVEVSIGCDMRAAGR